MHNRSFHPDLSAVYHNPRELNRAIFRPTKVHKQVTALAVLPVIPDTVRKMCKDFRFDLTLFNSFRFFCAALFILAVRIHIGAESEPFPVRRNDKSRNSGCDMCDFFCLAAVYGNCPDLRFPVPGRHKCNRFSVRHPAWICIRSRSICKLLWFTAGYRSDKDVTGGFIVFLQLPCYNVRNPFAVR